MYRSQPPAGYRRSAITQSCDPGPEQVQLSPHQRANRVTYFDIYSCNRHKGYVENLAQGVEKGCKGQDDTGSENREYHSPLTCRKFNPPEHA